MLARKTLTFVQRALNRRNLPLWEARLGSRLRSRHYRQKIRRLEASTPDQCPADLLQSQYLLGVRRRHRPTVENLKLRTHARAYMGVHRHDLRDARGLSGTDGPYRFIRYRRIQR